MCLSTKRPSSTFDTIHAILFIHVLSGFIICASSYSVNVSAPVFFDGQMETVKCQINNSVLDTGNCPASVTPIEFLEIVHTKNNITTKMCVFKSFLNCARFSQDSIANSCGCYSDGSDIYNVNVTVAADRTKFEGAIIDCKPSCIDNNGSNPLQSSYNGIPIVFVPTTSQSTTTAFTTASVTAPPCKNCSCTDNCPPSAKCPDWCIAVSVCVSVGGVGIITITVIIIKKKKAKLPGCRPTPPPDGNNRTEVPTINTKAEVGNNWTELTTTTAPGGNNRTELKTTTAPGGNNRTELNAHL